MDPKYFSSLVVRDNPRSSAAEAFRELRSNIQFTNLDKELKSIVVTSACPSDGKTTLVANLAVCFAQLGKKVVCVDTDLHKSSLHKIFGILNLKGLTDVLRGTCTLNQVMTQTQVEGLKIITSGAKPPNPSEILSSQKMKALIAQLAEVNDLVLYDTAPVISVTDAAILSSQTDGVLLLLDTKASTRQAVIRAKHVLELAKARILGVVLGKVSRENRGYYYYYYSHE